jgi:hypothetical protein
VLSPFLRLNLLG